MIYLIQKVAICLAAAGAVGLFIGWLIRHFSAISKLNGTISDWSNRLGKTEIQRDSYHDKYALSLQQFEDLEGQHGLLTAKEAKTFSELEESHSREDSLQTSLNQTRDEHSTSMRQLKSEISDANQQIDSLDSDLERAKKQAATEQRRLAGTLAETEQQRDQFSSNFAATEKQLGSERATTETLKQDLDVLQSQMQAANDANEQLRVEMHDGITKANASIEAEQKNNSDLKNQIGQWRKQAEEQTNRVAELEKANQDSSEEMSGLANSLTQAQTENAQLSTTMQNEKAKAVASIESLNGSLEVGRKDNTGLKSQIEQLQQQIESHKEHVAELEKSKRVSAHDMAGLANNLKNAQSQHEQLSAKIQDEKSQSNAAVQSLNASIESERKNNSGLKSQIGQLQQQAEKQNSLAIEVEQRLQQSSEENAALSTSLRNAQSDKEQLSDQLRDEKTKAGSSMQSLTSEIDSERKNNTHLKSAIAQLQQQIEKQKLKAAEQDKSHQQSAQENTRLGNELNAAQQKTQQLRTSMGEEVLTAKTSIQSLKESVKNAEQRRIRLEKDISQIQQKYTRQGDDVAQLKKANRALTWETNRLDKSLVLAEAAKTKTKANLDAIKEESQSQQLTLKTLETDRTRLGGELGKLKQHSAQLEKGQQAFKASQVKKVDVLSAENQKLTMALNSAIQKTGESNREQKELKKQLTKEHARHSSQDKQLSQFKQKLIHAETENSEILVTAKSDLDEAKIQTRQLKKEMSELNASLTAVKTKNVKLFTQIEAFDTTKKALAASRSDLSGSRDRIVELEKLLKLKVEAKKRPDDLKQIKGVGSKLERTLNGLGIYTFEQIAKFSTKNVDTVNEQLNFSGRIEREDWIGQAKILSTGGATKFSSRFGKAD